MPLDEQTATCPHCWERITLLVDASAGNQNYVEDCPVCCHPMLVAVLLDRQGNVVQLSLEREND